ncbi:hypothetical protein [Vagococcus carniphilus]|nr:hypothetical protein [Vagococcus carniphilus]
MLFIVRGMYQLQHIEDINNSERLTDTDILILLKILNSTRAEDV